MGIAQNHGHNFSLSPSHKGLALMPSGPHKDSLAFVPKLACECHLSIHNRLSFRFVFPSFTIPNTACKSQVGFVSVFYFIPIGVVFQPRKDA